MFTIIICLCILATTAFACKYSMYNTRYCISKPHYLSLTGPRYMPPSPNTQKTNVDYELPKSMKKMFVQNLPYNKRN